MPDEQQAHFEGWAKVEVMGHQTHIGFVKTEAYGQAVLFRIDTPELPEREFISARPQYVTVNGSQTWAPVGSKIKRAKTPEGTALVGAGSIYRIIPCTEAAALHAIEQDARAEFKLVELPPDKVLEAPTTSRDYTCCHGNAEDGHEPGCPNEYQDDIDREDNPADIPEAL